MSTASAVHDVFLSFASQDSAIAEIVAREISEAGLSVFVFEPVDSAQKTSDPIREAITECSVVVAIVSPTTTRSTWQGIEIGAAMAWDKPVFVILEGVPSSQLPMFLRRFPVYPSSRLSELVRAVRRELESEPQFTDGDRTLLRRLYVEIGESADQLAIQPGTMGLLSKKFNRARGQRLTPEKILQELFRLRKRGELPSLRGSRAD